MKFVMLLLIILTASADLNFGQESSEITNSDTISSRITRLTFSSHKRFKKDDFKKGVVFSPLQLIQGKVPGLAIMNMTGNDQNPYMQSNLRGASTMLFETNISYVINGIPVANADFITPENIESIEVAGNLSEAARYGLRGSNGIIKINTLKRSKEKFALSYSNWFFTERISKESDYLSPSEVRQLISLWGSLGPAQVNDMAVYYISDVEDFDSSTDWINEITQKRISQMHNISLNGNHKNTAYSLSFCYRDYYGIIKRNESDISAGQLSLSQNFLRNRMNLNFSSIWSIKDYSDYNTNPYLKGQYLSSSPNIFVHASRFNPTMAVYDSNGEYTSYYIDLGRYQNPVSGLFNTLDSRKNKSFLTSINAEYKIIEGLELSASVAKLDLEKEFLFSRSYPTDYGITHDNTNESHDYGQFFLKSQLSFTNTLQDHYFKLLMSYSYERFQFEKNKFYYSVDSWLPGQHNSGGSHGIIPDLISQLFINADYAFKNKYLISAGFLSERSKLFPYDPSSHSFPSFKAGWVLSNEKFLVTPQWMDYLEIYSEYGKSRRNVFLPDYDSRNRLASDEILKEHVYGMNLILINKSVSLIIEHYNRITTDGIWQETLPWNTGIYITNALKIRNRGWEFSTRFNPISRKKFQWTSDANLLVNNNKVLSDYILNSLADRYGQPVGTIIGNRFAGFDSDNRMLVYDAKDNPVHTAYREYLENSIPKLFFGFTNCFVFKNFDLSLLLRGAAGHYIHNISMYDLPHGGFNIKKNLLVADMRLINYGEWTHMDYLLEKGSFVKADNVMLGYTIYPELWKIKKFRLFIACNNLATFTKFSGMDPEMVPISGANIGQYSVDLYPVTRIYSAGLKIEIR